ncbi:hypothetical protein ACFSJS_22640 [Streptomyces desertarenae]|uniref:Uncharacterized protein n=1 Tax=Streptomyces desertarenae TaxID=2666184 RepID=A0ABW4PNV0_9ACTN
MHPAFAAVSLAAAVGSYAALAHYRADRAPIGFLLGLIAGLLLAISLVQ